MKRYLAIIMTIMVCLTSMLHAEAEDEGYFLSLKQKGQLITSGRMQDSQGRWYDVRICPGYQYPLQYGWRNLKQAGGNLHEYIESETYEELGEDSRSNLDWAFGDCFKEFTWTGSGKAWSKNFGRAQKRVERKVFGWWLSYPWAFMQSTADNVVRIPVGLTGTAFGTFSGTVVVPAGYMLAPSLKAVWNGGVEGCVFPVSGIAWNTVVSPPMALVGQKPSLSRTDDFWVRVVPDARDVKKAPTEEDLAVLASWGEVLYDELAVYEKRRTAAEQEKEQRIKDLKAEISRIRKEKTEEIESAIREEQAHLEKLSSLPKYEDLLACLRRNGWSAARLEKHRELVNEFMSDKHGTEKTDETIALLRQFFESRDYKEGMYEPLEKTDPVKESIEVIKEIE